MNSVKERGTLICALEKKSSKLAGIVIIAPFDSRASKMAAENESEIHVLSVKKYYRNNVLGKLLIKHAVDTVRCKGHSKNHTLDATKDEGLSKTI